LEYTRGGAYWRQDKSGVRFMHECVKRTQIANTERTRSEPREDPERTQSECKIFKSERRANPGSALRVRSGVRLRSVGTVGRKLRANAKILLPYPGNRVQRNEI
jgi:hypothetical protein